MDFTNIDLGEDLGTEHNQVERDAWQAEQEARIRKESLQKFGVAPISKVQLPRVAANPVTQQEYNTRLFTLLNIIREPKRAANRYPLSDTWKELYPMIPYNDKATNWKISKKDAETIINEMKAHGVYKRFRMDGVASVIARVKEHYQTTRINELEDRVTKLELMLSEDGSVWYKGIEIKRLARTFQATIGDSVISTRHGTFDKMSAFLADIDKLIV
tara:strand:- start:260 stop:907 length:648 start_codon:yes stop_codon:yes gene_type:complete